MSPTPNASAPTPDGGTLAATVVERTAEVILSAMLHAGVCLDDAVLYTFAWLEAIERWQAHMRTVDA